MVASSAFAQKDRKVPPRTPSQRFETLNRFINEWIDYNIDQDLNRPMRAYNMVSSIDPFPKHLIRTGTKIKILESFFRTYLRQTKVRL